MRKIFIAVALTLSLFKGISFSAERAVLGVTASQVNTTVASTYTALQNQIGNITATISTAANTQQVNSTFTTAVGMVNSTQSTLLQVIASTRTSLEIAIGTNSANVSNFVFAVKASTESNYQALQSTSVELTNFKFAVNSATPTYANKADVIFSTNSLYDDLGSLETTVNYLIFDNVANENNITALSASTRTLYGSATTQYSAIAISTAQIAISIASNSVTSSLNQSRIGNLTIGASSAPASTLNVYDSQGVSSITFNVFTATTLPVNIARFYAPNSLQVSISLGLNDTDNVLMDYSAITKESVFSNQTGGISFISAPQKDISIVSGNLLTINSVTGINLYAGGPFSINNSSIVVSGNDTRISAPEVIVSTLVVSNPVDIKGRVDGSSVPVGVIGEYFSSATAKANAFTLTSDTGVDVASFTLAAGEWEIGGSANFGGGAVTAAAFSAFFSVVPGNSVIGFDDTSNAIQTASMPSAATDITSPLPTFRVVITTATTYYLKLKASTVTVGSPTGWGRIWARRQ